MATKCDYAVSGCANFQFRLTRMNDASMLVPIR
jgi:hypothetical protein